MGSPSLHSCSLFASNQALGSGLIVFRLSRTLDATAAFCALSAIRCKSANPHSVEDLCSISF